MTNVAYHINAVQQILHDYCTSKRYDSETVSDLGTQETKENIRTTYCTDDGHEFHIVYSVPKQCYTVETF